mmetsp:Transcript_2957/g.11292  ORF Transcript_2957/g.11292 Transcript_2957/m.11292 type:complete len:106 (-) Transcript_2957:2497-2814(-)
MRDLSHIDGVDELLSTTRIVRREISHIIHVFSESVLAASERYRTSIWRIFIPVKHLKNRRLKFIWCQLESEDASDINGRRASQRLGNIKMEESRMNPPSTPTGIA